MKYAAPGRLPGLELIAQPLKRPRHNSFRYSPNIVEAFFVTCETCRARLKVRSAEAIGEIHACPRCESMVLIAAPVGFAAMQSAAAASSQAAPGAETFARVAVPSQQSADAFAAAAVAVLAGASASIAAAEVEPPIDVHVSGIAATVPASNSMLATARGLWHAYPVAALGGAAAALLAVGGLAMAVWPSGESATETAAPAAIAQAPPLTDERESSPPDVDLENTFAAEVVAPLAEQAPNEFASPSRATDDEGETVSVVPAPASEPPPLAAAEVLPDTRAARADVDAMRTVSDSTAMSAPPVVQPQPEAKPVFKLDPLNFDPMRLSLPPSGAQDVASQATLASESMSESANEIALASADIANVARAVEPDAAAHEEDPTINVRRGPPSSETPVQRDVAAQLALPVKSISLQAVPLEQFLRQMADLAGVPITLDPAALEMTGMSPRRELTIDAQEATIERVLRDTLARRRLDIAERDGQLVIIRSAANGQLPSRYDVQDLVSATEKDASQLAALIQRFVAPDSWQPVGGAGEIAVEGKSFQIQQADESHIGLILFCERLRLARGLLPKSAYPIERLNVESPYGRLAGKLSRPTTFTFMQWTPLVDVVRDWQARCGITLLVDWQALAELEWTPSSALSCSAINRTWEDSLDAILEPLGLGWWAIDGETIQITSRAKLARLRRIEFYVLPSSLREQFASPAALAGSLVKEVEKQLASEANQAALPPHIELDAVSGRLIVLGTADAHRYLTRRLSAE